MAIDNKGFVLVTDCYNNRIQKFTTKGQFVSLFNVEGTNPCPSGITVDDNDLVYVNNNHTKYVTVYTTNGEHVGSIDKEFVNNSNTIYFHGIACDNNGYLYVCCYNDNNNSNNSDCDDDCVVKIF